MIRKIFTPRAPKPAPEGARFRFHFASDAAKPPVVVPTVQLDDAVSRVQAELASLRATVAAGSGTRSAGELQADIGRTQAEATAASKVLERKRAQCVAGLIEIAEVAEIERERNSVAAKVRALQDELQKRNAADAAQTAIDSILRAVV